MPIQPQPIEKVQDLKNNVTDPFADSIPSVSRQNSLPFWLGRSWIPAETEYPTDDETGSSLFGFRHSTSQVLVYDCSSHSLKTSQLGDIKHFNDAEGDYTPITALFLQRGSFELLHVGTGARIRREAAFLKATIPSLGQTVEAMHRETTQGHLAMRSKIQGDGEQGDPLGYGAVEYRSLE